MQPCPGNCVAIWRAVVNYAQAAHACSAGIKCWHCIIINNSYTVCGLSRSNTSMFSIFCSVGTWLGNQLFLKTEK